MTQLKLEHAALAASASVVDPLEKEPHRRLGHLTHGLGERGQRGGL